MTILKIHTSYVHCTVYILKSALETLYQKKNNYILHNTKTTKIKVRILSRKNHSNALNSKKLNCKYFTQILLAMVHPPFPFCATQNECLGGFFSQYPDAPTSKKKGVDLRGQ
jgi:hypothetical protein